MRNHVGVRLQELEHETVGQQTVFVHGVEHRVVPERRPAFVHHLGLPLRIEVLRRLAHDAHDLALPGLQQRRMLFNEVQDVFLWFFRKAAAGFLDLAVGGARQRAPQVVHLLLLVDLALRPPRLFLGE